MNARWVNTPKYLSERRYSHVKDYPDNPIPQFVDGKLNPEWENAPYGETITWLNIADNKSTT